jgi:2-methylaconitate cis-trans-isomerase PrpF
MLLGCWCARRALKYIPEEETRPLKAIEAKEAWARGETTREEMVVARNAAYEASREAYAAANDTALDISRDITLVATSAVAWAAASATASATAANAALAAEWAAALAAVNVSVYNISIWVDIRAANDEESLVQAEYIRTQFILPKGDLCLLNNN